MNKNFLVNCFFVLVILIASSGKAQSTKYVSSTNQLLDVLSDITSGSSNINHIILESGTYNLSSGIQLAMAHSGITISGCEGVYINGGIVLETVNFVDFNSLTSPGFTLANASAANNIKVLDLNSVGLTQSDLGSINWHALNVEDFDTPSVLWLDGKKMDLARWPNKQENMTSEQMIMPGNWGDVREDMHGQISYYEILATGTPNSISDGMQFTVHNSLKSKITSWDFYKTSTSEHLWTDGVFHASWEWEYNKVTEIDANGNITLQHGSLSSFNIITSTALNPPTRQVSSDSNTKPSHFYFENVPEELDNVGEYFIDRDNMLLYFYPPAGWEAKQLVLSTLNDNIFTINNASNITIENLTLQSGLKNGIEINSSSDIVVQNNIIRYFNQWGVRVLGSNNIIDNCELYGLGGGGVSLGENKNTYTLIKENNSVINSAIYDFAWDQKSQVPGVAISGVSNKVINNDISDGTHFGVKLRQARESIVEKNRIHDLPTYHHFDGGAVYLGLGLNFHNRENRINNNYIYNVPTNGIYFDNYTNGSFAEGNVLYNIGNSTLNAANFAAIYNHGGGQNYFKNNIAIDCSVIIKTGSHIVKQGNAYRYHESWYTDVAQAPLTSGSQTYNDYVSAYTASDIESYMIMLDNLPTVVKNNITSLTGSNWSSYRAIWDPIGYDATVGNANANIGSELQEWKNYFKLRYCESFISNNLGLYTDAVIYNAENTKAALNSRGDGELFWEYSAYNNVFSNHVVINNEKYNVSETNSIFPDLVSNGSINESSYAVLGHSGGNLSSAISHDLSLRGDLNNTTFSNCNTTTCTDLGMQDFGYKAEATCNGGTDAKSTYTLVAKDVETGHYTVDLSSGIDSSIINLFFLLDFDESTSPNGTLDDSVLNLPINDVIQINGSTSDFVINSVSPLRFPLEEPFCWNWNRRINIQLKYTGTDYNELHPLDITFNPNKSLISTTGNAYCSQQINLNVRVNNPNLSIKNPLEHTTKLYPNPVQNVLNIESENDLDKVELYNVFGQKVSEFKLQRNNATIDLTNLGSGLYMAYIYMLNQKEVFKVLKD